MAACVSQCEMEKNKTNQKNKMSDMNMMTKGEHYSKIEIPSIWMPNKLLSTVRVHAHACNTQYMRHGWDSWDGAR